MKPNLNCCMWRIRSLEKVLLIIAFAAMFVTFLALCSVVDGTKKEVQKAHLKRRECFHGLRRLNFSSPNLLVADVSFLQDLLKDCNATPKFPLTVLVPHESYHKMSKEDFAYLRPVPFNETSDYFIANDNAIIRLLPKVQSVPIGNLRLPSYVEAFIKFWQRSKKVECKNTLRRDADVNRSVPLEGITSVVRVRDILLDFEAYPVLAGGTLLGWYRECSIIPHTYDIDLNVEVEDITPAIEYKLRKLPYGGPLSLYRVFGKLEDGYELTVYSNEYEFTIDVFAVYHNNSHAWSCGTGAELDKYRYYFSRIDEYCAADFLGYLFHVPCKVELNLEEHYGKDWGQDVQTDDFAWNDSGSNVQFVGYWDKNESSAVYQILF